MIDVRRELNAEENSDLLRGHLPRHYTSAGQLLVALLELEEQQRGLKAMRDSLADGKVNTRSVSAEDKDTALRRKIALLRPIQKLYMPGMVNVIDEEDELDVDDDAPDGATAIALHLPSSVPQARRRVACCEGLAEKELRLRLPQADDALNSMRKHLRVSSLVFDFRAQQTAGTGQKANTRMRALQARYENLVKMDAARYRAARLALCALDPDGEWKVWLQELDDKDIRPIRREKGQSDGRHRLSWIWLAATPAARGEGIEGRNEDLQILSDGECRYKGRDDL